MKLSFDYPESYALARNEEHPEGFSLRSEDCFIEIQLPGRSLPEGWKWDREEREIGDFGAKIDTYTKWGRTYFVVAYLRDEESKKKTNFNLIQDEYGKMHPRKCVDEYYQMFKTIKKL